MIKELGFTAKIWFLKKDANNFYGEVGIEAIIVNYSMGWQKTIKWSIGVDKAHTRSEKG